MKPTRPRTLLVAALAAGVVTYVVLTGVYLRLPDALPRTAPLSVLFAGLLEIATSVSVRARLSRRAGARPIAPLTVARLAALGKASSLIGAVVLGFWTGVLANTLPRGSEPPVAGADSITAGLGMAAAVVLLAGAVLLERFCRIRR